MSKDLRIQVPLQRRSVFYSIDDLFFITFFTIGEGRDRFFSKSKPYRLTTNDVERERYLPCIPNQRIKKENVRMR